MIERERGKGEGEKEDWKKWKKKLERGSNGYEKNVRGVKKGSGKNGKVSLTRGKGDKKECEESNWFRGKMGRGMIKGELGEVKTVESETCGGGRTGLWEVKMVARAMCAGGQMAMRIACGEVVPKWEGDGVRINENEVYGVVGLGWWGQKCGVLRW